MNRLDRILDFLIAHPVQREVQAYRRARIAGIIQRQWKKEELAEEKRRFCVGLCQDIRDFERKTGLKVKSVKIKRDKQGVESVMVKAEIQDRPGAVI
ncbi:hypothetical protein [Syntrophus aciditrophicus]|jgi:hypothetical protein|uniref:Hypothetical cytosolic protein n=1 Tax=Syntrophus aciditrophicus (strain SB) TaxID=56780 RepID=Q2LXX9_SYNAS|nr:hypothetical protein [Syntrophus aciditrophicus]ABC78943.1 hypothetical cytosolic protein [Syntrophus aciditrophicus SB]OPY19247.1 MAG: hypothetical protein A4E74_00041 [Syntrophus sp. PtaB.Bin075]